MNSVDLLTSSSSLCHSYHPSLPLALHNFPRTKLTVISLGTWRKFLAGFVSNLSVYNVCTSLIPADSWNYGDPLYSAAAISV
jgi:hypothetical protein